MAFMSARINMPTQVSGTGLGSILAGALFSDPEQEIALAKLRSELSTEAYRRQQIQSAIDYNQMRTDTGNWELDSRKGAVGPLGKILYGAQGEEPAAVDLAPVDLSGPETGAPIPMLRPDAMPAEVAPVPVQTTEPDIQISPPNYPLRPDAPMPEPDMQFGSYGAPGGPALPATAPVPVRRPGDVPPLPASLSGVPPDLMPGAQAAPVNTVRPEPRVGDLRPTIIDPAVLSTFPVRPAPRPQPLPLAPTLQPVPGVQDVMSTFPARPVPEPPGQVAAWPDRGVPADQGNDRFITIQDFMREPAANPAAQPQAPEDVTFLGSLIQSLRNIGLPSGQLPGAETPPELSMYKAPGPFPARPNLPVPPDAGQPPALSSLPAHETGRRPGTPPPFQPNGQLGEVPPDLLPPRPQGAFPGVTGLPPELQPVPVTVPEPENYPSLAQTPPELTPMGGQGASVSVPGRSQPPVPPAQAGGPATLVPGRTSTEMMRDRPPPVSPDYPVSPNAFPVTATGDVVVEPETGTVVVHTSQGSVRLTQEEANAVAQGLVASSTSAADLASGEGKMAGLIGLQAGGQTPDQQRVSAMEYTGVQPDTNTMITSQDTAPATYAAQKAAADAAAAGADPTKMKENILVIDNVPYQVGTDAQGNRTLTRISTSGGVDQAGGEQITIPDLAPDVASTSQGAGQLNILADVNAMVDKGMPIPPAIARVYAAAFNDLYGEKATTARTEKGLETTFTGAAVPPGTRTPDEISGTSAAPAAAGAASAPAPAGGAPGAPNAPASPPAAAAAPETPSGPVVGSHMSTVTTGKGKEQVKNYGGWVGEGEPEPVETFTETGPGGTTVRRTNRPQQRTKQATEESQQAYRMLFEAIRAARTLDNTPPDKLPSSYQDAMTAIQSAAGESSGDILLSSVLNRLTSEDARSYARAIFTFMNAKLRPDTGAAISQKEFNLYRDRFAMHPGEKWQGYDETRLGRNDAMRSMRMSLNDQMPAKALRELDLEMARQGLDLEWKPPQKKVFKPDGKGGYE